ncbi:MAG: biotin--[acetyl-CoA-carboxylase] ligase, partial [Spirochaetia bacterium]|nr:biotin--[acetyl-CoA-carboxylase] ligase [Spirochaetia bacterium]
MFTIINEEDVMNSKEIILKKLRESGGMYLSGEAIAKELEISRAAVWKAIHSLRSSGITIESSTNVGYRLKKESNALHKESILSLLSKEIKNRVTLYVYDSIDSTNQEAKRLLTSDATDCTIILASEQSKGRGRLGRVFYSPQGTGLYLTFIVKQQLNMNDALRITSVAAVASSRAIEEVVEANISIKWVNDLYKEGKKVAGILTEGVSNFESGKVESIIIGIGINIFPPKEGFPLELKDIATSLLEKEEDVINN